MKMKAVDMKWKYCTSGIICVIFWCAQVFVNFFDNIMF